MIDPAIGAGRLTWVRFPSAAPASRQTEATSANANQIKLEKSHGVRQRSFTLRWGQTPMQYVAARRLEAVHARMQAFDPNLTVARAAMDCGFCHLGRFAVLYKEAYGQSPSWTVARARQAIRSDDAETIASRSGRTTSMATSCSRTGE